MPAVLAPFKLELSASGLEITYTYENQEEARIPELLKAVTDAGIVFKDLHTSQSSLEDIFVNLVTDRKGATP